MSSNESTSTPAKILYRPIGMVGSLVAGAVAGAVFKQVWKLVTPKSMADEAPKALESDFDLKEVLAAAALQGAIFAVVKALVDRGGARGFQRVFGEWPGN
ncbi:DUF4235 domain-containing protein [Brachybacterium huguangmaarense]|uniref:DUF4235 domain-containing protein n=1 Tax=Brachybacterium huguangmaarense TaxID=1652028 RepID=A0ABY6G370_9MICO|nr:DUF4235 domain-containing protein [Brachybacterium huguangmaarense]UYG17654.1 DUF4235 domain-containing protein [Brachybacterium huguangmaarense]